MSRERRAGGVSCQGFIATAFLLALLPSPSRATFGLTSRRAASPPPPPPLPATPPTPLAPITHASSLSRKGKDDDDDKSPSLIEDILRRLRGDFSHPLSDSTRLVVHYDCRDYRSGLRGLGLRHVWRDVGQTFLEEEGEEEEGMEGVGRGGRKAGWKAWVFPWEIRGGMSVKRIHGVGIPQFWRMGRLDRLLWGSVHAISLPTSTSVGAAFDGASQHMRFEMSHATALSLPFLDKEGEWGFLDGLPIRMTLSPLLARRPINLSAAIPRRPAFHPSVDLLSLGLGCEWVEPMVGGWEEGGREEGREKKVWRRCGSGFRHGLSAPVAPCESHGKTPACWMGRASPLLPSTCQ
ncbi:Hypothetical protein NocV09_00800330 [Nannochloropsis oceanica]